MRKDFRTKRRAIKPKQTSFNKKTEVEKLLYRPGQALKKLEINKVQPKDPRRAFGFKKKATGVN